MQYFDFKKEQRQQLFCFLIGYRCIVIQFFWLFLKRNKTINQLNQPEIHCEHMVQAKIYEE